MRIIYLDVASVILSLTVLAFIIFKHYTKGRTNRFIIILAVLFVAGGILDCYDSMFGGIIPASAENARIQFVSNTVFYVLRNLMTPIYILFLYSYLGIWYKLHAGRKHFMLLFCPIVFLIACLVLNCFTRLFFFIDDNGVYNRGRFIWVIYIVGFYYIAYTTVLLFKYRKTLRRSDFAMLSSLVVFNFAAFFIQRINVNLRVEMMSLALTIFMVATVIQRPEELTDSVIGTLSLHGFLTDMRKVYDVGRPINILLIKITNHRALRTNLGLEIYNEALKRVGNKFVQMSRIINLYADVYYNGRGVFAIVTDANKHEQTLDMGRLIVAYLKESFTLSNLEIKLNAKVCLATAPEDIPAYTTMLNFSNTFANTIPDRDQVVVLSEIIESHDFRMKNEIDEVIKRGIAGKRFKMFYQPIYSVEKDRFVSAEALIRLKDDEYGYVSPGIFIPAAEDSGAIHDIGDFVLEEVCRFIHGSEFAKSGLEYIEINLSVAQCIEPGLIDKITGLISKYHIKTSQINLEITETAADYDPVITDNNIFGLWNMGFKFSLDDYGTGYSNIKRVVSLPLDIVKFDKSFVDEMDDPNMWIAIVNTVSMLKRMKKKILVEGVEDKETLDRFIKLGCDYIQGFYFSKPLDQTSFLEFVKEKNSGRIYEA